MMRSVRRLRKWIWRFLCALTIGRIMMLIFFLTAGFGVFAVIKESQIPDSLRLMPVPKQHKHPMPVPFHYQSGEDTPPSDLK